jgi:hypothetical protein
VARYAFYELSKDRDEGRALGLAVELLGVIGGQQRRHIGKERRVVKFFPHALLGLGAGDSLSAGFEILAEHNNNMRGIETRKQRDSLREIDEVSAFVALEQRPKLGGKNLFAAKGDDVCLACEPK